MADAQKTWMRRSTLQSHKSKIRILENIAQEKKVIHSLLFQIMEELRSKRSRSVAQAVHAAIRLVDILRSGGDIVMVRIGPAGKRRQQVK